VGQVVEVALGGGPSTTLASTASATYFPSDIAVDETRVYWTGFTTGEVPGGTVMSVGKHGGAPTTLASGSGEPTGIAVDATSAYWADFYEGTVMKVALAGGTPPHSRRSNAGHSP
jgi:hypothetical protein